MPPASFTNEMSEAFGPGADTRWILLGQAQVQGEMLVTSDLSFGAWKTAPLAQLTLALRYRHAKGVGDIALCTEGCLDDNRTTTSMLIVEAPDAGDGFWFLVRGQNCGGSGTYDSGGPAQVGGRDLEIASSGAACP